MINAGFAADPILRRRVTLLLLTEFLWGIGVYASLSSTTLPIYLQRLGAGWMIGLAATAMGALPLLLQFFGRSIIDRFTHRQRGLIVMHLVVILPYFLIALADAVFAGRQPGRLAWVVLGLLAFSQIAIGLVVPLWLDMIAQVIPPSIRGRYFGLASGFVAFGGILGGGVQMLLVGWLKEGAFRGVFLTTGLCYLLSMAVFSRVAIPPESFAHPPEPSVLARLRVGLRACRPQCDFARFVASALLLAFAASITTFLVVYATDARHGLGLPQSVFSQMTLLQAIGGMAGSITLGWLVDRHGPRWPWFALIGSLPLVLLLFPFARAGSFTINVCALTLYPVFIGCALLIGTLGVNWSVSAPAMLEYSPAGDKSSYIAVANIAGFLPALLGPKVMETLIHRQGYSAAFLTAIIASGLAMLLACSIRTRRMRAERDNPESTLEFV